jgi:hypothetical protein
MTNIRAARSGRQSAHVDGNATRLFSVRLTDKLEKQV